jgi:hypothetical protein
MWRSAAGVKTPKVVFRALVRVAVDLRPVEQTLADAGWDDIRRGGLLRLVRGWFPELLGEFWCDEIGNDPPSKTIEVCAKPYHYKLDRNLGKERAAQIREKFGDSEWQKYCQTAAKRALAAVKKLPDFASARSRAQASAEEHFAILRARLKARQDAGIDSATQSNAERKLGDTLATLVTDILAAPVITLDTLGAYVLSEKPWWPEPDWDPELASRSSKR